MADKQATPAPAFKTSAGILTRGQEFPFHPELERTPIANTVGKAYVMREMNVSKQDGRTYPRVLVVLEERWDRQTGEVYPIDLVGDFGRHVRVNCSGVGISGDVQKLARAGLPRWIEIEAVPQEADPSRINYRVKVETAPAPRPAGRK